MTITIDVIVIMMTNEKAKAANENASSRKIRYTRELHVGSGEREKERRPLCIANQEKTKPTV